MIKDAYLKLLRLPDPYALPEQTFSEPGMLINRVKELIPDPATICEVGSWLGASLLGWARANPNTILCAVDTWLGSAEHYENHDYMLRLPKLYEDFIALTRPYAEQIIPVRLSSVAAAEFFHNRKLTFDVIYLDAGHSRGEVLLDLEQYYALLSRDGIICGDDWTWGSVKEAVTVFAGAHKQAIETYNNSWLLR